MIQACALLGFFALANLVGPMAEQVRCLVAAACALVCIFASNLEPKARILSGVVLAGMIVVEGSVAKAVLYCGLIALVMPAGGGGGVLGGILLVYLGLDLSNSGLLAGAREAGRFVVGPLAEIGRRGPGLDSSALGLDRLMILGAVVVLGGAGRKQELVRASLLVLVAVLRFPAALFFQDRAGPHAGHHHPIEWFSAESLVVVMQVGIACVRAGGWQRWALGPRFEKLHWRPVPGWVFGATLGLFASCVSFTSLTYSREEREVWLAEEIGGDWDVPTYDKVGAFSAGMFGLLPGYLEALGLRSRLVDRSALASVDVGRAGVLVLINSPRAFDAEEIRAVERFVREGGSLLVLGDHTNVYGLRDNLNEMLRFSGISFNFDSAVALDDSWTGDVEYVPGPFGAWLPAEALGIATGASLLLSDGAFPVVRARYGFSDSGIEDNVPGAFLGNLALDEEEVLGDIVLVAGAVVGRGRVLVFGDTSGFQNSQIAGQMPGYIWRLLRVLDGDRPSFLSFAGRSALLIVILAAAIAALFDDRHWVAVTAAAITLPVLVDPYMPVERIVPAEGMALIDFTHSPDHGHYGAQWNSLGQLPVWLAREGRLSLVLFEWRGEWLARARILISIAPQEAFTPAELEDVQAFLLSGGMLLVAARGLDPGLERLLGIRIEEQEMGPVPPKTPDNDASPRFVEAHRVHSIGPGEEGESLYSWGSVDLVIAKRFGEGLVVVLGDPRFFSAHNVESMAGYWAGNIRLTRDLLEYGTRGPESAN